MHRMHEEEKDILVPPTCLDQLQPDDFADDEFYLARNYDTNSFLNHTAHLPYYLHHFQRVINSVPLHGKNTGYIQLPVWRSALENDVQNIRVMENILSFAYFYTADKKWNPYYGSDHVRKRLEASLTFWLDQQWADGRFPESNPNHELPMAATAFATRYMGEALRLLHQEHAPPIDSEILQHTIQADRKAIMAVLTITDPDMFDRGKVYTNQYGNVWAGGLVYLHLFPSDVELKTALRRRMMQSETEFQSPSGFWYERESPDWGYYINTHRVTTRLAWHYANNTQWQDHFIRTESKFYDWLSYNCVPEPDGSAFILNRSIETRQKVASFQRLDNAIAEKIPLARAFAATKNEIDQQISVQRSLLQESWPTTASLEVGNFNAFSPVNFLLQSVDAWTPTEEQREAALKLLPYFASERFNQVRVDTRRALITSFARRPDYYAVFNAGQKARGTDRSQQNLGLGLLWNQRAGTFLQTQTGPNAAAWGTKGEGMDRPCEGYDFMPWLKVDGVSKPLRPGITPLADGKMVYTYHVGERGSKTVSFEEDRITIQIQYEGTFSEHIPLLTLPNDVWSQDEGRVTLIRNGVTFTIEFQANVHVNFPVDFSQQSTHVQKYSVQLMTLTTDQSLHYSLKITNQEFADQVVTDQAAIQSLPAHNASNVDINNDVKNDANDKETPNLALSSAGTTVTASSSNSTNSEKYVNDGNHLLHWCPLRADTVDGKAWLTLDFKKETTLNQMELDMSGMDGPPRLTARKLKLPDEYQLKYLTDPDFQGTYDNDPSKWRTIIVRSLSDYEFSSGIDDIVFDAVTTNRITILFTVSPAEADEVPAPRIREIGVYYSEG